MTLKFFKLLQRNIEDDLNIIIPSNTDFLDELVEDCLPLLKGCFLIGACPSEQIAAIIFSFLVFLLYLLQLVLCTLRKSPEHHEQRMHQTACGWLHGEGKAVPL